MYSFQYGGDLVEYFSRYAAAQVRGLISRPYPVWRPRTSSICEPFTAASIGAAPVPVLTDVHRPGPAGARRD